MGELPPTGGAAFIAAGGVAHTRGGGGVIWPVDIPEGRELCLAPKAGLWGSQPAFVTQSEAGGELGRGRRSSQHHLCQLVGNTNLNPPHSG